jgi:hypothetical protein
MLVRVDWSAGRSTAPPNPDGQPRTTQPLRQDLFAAATAVATAQPERSANLYRPQVAPPEAESVPIADQLSRTLTKAEEPHEGRSRP